MQLGLQCTSTPHALAGGWPVKRPPTLQARLWRSEMLRALRKHKMWLQVHRLWDACFVRPVLVPGFSPLSPPGKRQPFVVRTTAVGDHLSIPIPHGTGVLRVAYMQSAAACAAPNTKSPPPWPLLCGGRLRCMMRRSPVPLGRRSVFHVKGNPTRHARQAQPAPCAPDGSRGVGLPVCFSFGTSARASVRVGSFHYASFADLPTVLLPDCLEKWKWALKIVHYKPRCMTSCTSSRLRNLFLSFCFQSTNETIAARPEE